MRTGKLVICALALIVAMLCGAVTIWMPRDRAEELFVYSGAGIRPALEEIRRDFTTETGIPVQVTYSGSGCLLSMLTFARSGDLYLPGELYYLSQARKDGHISDERVVAHFVAVVMTAPGNPKGIRTLGDLARPDIRVGIGQPKTVACGRVARKILQKAGVWEAVKTNIDKQGAYTGTAMELSNALVLRALDAAINWDAMAYPVRDRVEILPIPRDQNVAVAIPLGTLSWTEQPDAAAAFLAFVASEAGQRRFAQHGYHTSPEPYILDYYGDTMLE